MKNNNIFLVGVLCTVLVACGGTKDDETTVTEKQISAARCEQINNTEYATETLEEGGRAEGGVASMHWRVSFADGVMTMFQSDFILTAKYVCDGQTITADLGDMGVQQLNFERHNIALYFSPFGGESKTYLRFEEPLVNACELVAGKRFVEPQSSSKLPNPIIAFAPLYYEFGQGQQVNYTVGGDVLVTGIYECGLGQLHIHADAKDNNPQIVKVAKDGQSISVDTGGSTPLDFVLEKEQIACTQEYAPVCSADLGSIQCIKAPCADGQYKTYSNRCTSDANNALYLMDGECGKLEGQIYEKPAKDDPIVCDTIYDPICAVKLGTIQCITEPCPIGSYQTYSNLCSAEADKSLIIKKGECGKLEGQPYEKKPPVEDPVACIDLYSPVCGVELSTIQCLTEPCPLGTYKTYSNFCYAGIEKALVISEGECGKLEGSPYEKSPEDNPPVCTKEYAPVCAAELGTIQCFTAPCPAGQYKTYPNRCVADSAKTTFIMGGECGELEGQVYDDPKP